MTTSSACPVHGLVRYQSSTCTCPDDTRPAGRHAIHPEDRQMCRDCPDAATPGICDYDGNPCDPHVQTGGRHAAILTHDDRHQLRTAIANGYHDHTADDRAAEVAEQLLARHTAFLHRESDVLAQALHRVGAYPLDYPRTPDGIRAWARMHALNGTTIEKDGD